MNVLAILCLLLLAPYVVIALAFMPKGKGKQLFNMVYSALALGGVGALVFILCQQYASDYKNFVEMGADRLYTILGFLFLMIPVVIVLVILNMVLKKPRGGLLFFIAAGLSLADGVGVCVFAYFSENSFASFLPMAIPAAAVLVPLCWALAAGGLLPFAGKLGRAVHWTVQSLIFLLMAGLIVYGAFSIKGMFGAWDMSMLRFAPIALAALIIPGVPLVIYFYDMVKRSDRPARVPRKKRANKAKAAQ